jgi:hypothetical protein
MYNYEELPAFKAKLAVLRGEAPAEDVPAEEGAAEHTPGVGDPMPEPDNTPGESDAITPDTDQPLAGEGAVAA